MKKGRFDVPKVLVTGGTGFLGIHLCERLLRDNFEVICLDNFFTGQKRNIMHLLNNPWFSPVHHDICLPYSIDIDFIVNLACPASPPYYQFDPVKTINTNVMGSINMLELARHTKARILQASTSVNMTGFICCLRITREAQEELKTDWLSWRITERLNK